MSVTDRNTRFRPRHVVRCAGVRCRLTHTRDARETGRAEPRRALGAPCVCLARAYSERERASPPRGSAARVGASEHLRTDDAEVTRVANVTSGLCCLLVRDKWTRRALGGDCACASLVAPSLGARPHYRSSVTWTAADAAFPRFSVKRPSPICLCIRGLSTFNVRIEIYACNCFFIHIVNVRLFDGKLDFAEFQCVLPRLWSLGKLVESCFSFLSRANINMKYFSFFFKIGIL